MSKSNKVRALKRFTGTSNDGNSSRWFNRGEVVPPEFLERITRPGFVDQPLETADGSTVDLPEFPGFAAAKKVQEVLAWVDEADDYEERVRRARHALTAEQQGQQRKRLLEALPQFIVDED